MMHTEAMRDIELPGAMRSESHAGSVAAVVRISQRNQIVVAGVSARHEQREIVGFRAGIDKITDLQFAGHFRRELLRVLSDVRMQINRRRVLQEFILPPRCLDHVRMTVTDADGRNATERIKISASTLVEDVLAFAFDDHQWSFVIKEYPGIQKLATQPQHLFRGWPPIRLRLIIKRR